MNFYYLYIAFKKLCGKKQPDGFMPFDKRTTAHPLSAEDFHYSLKLGLKHKWLNRYSNQLDETIYQLLDNRNKKRLFKKLLDGFIYISKDRSQELIDLIVKHILNVWNCNPEDTIIIGIKKENNPHPDGSSVLLYRIKNGLYDWRSDHFLNEFSKEIIEKYKNYNIILCDDFIGSGSTIYNRVHLAISLQNPKKKLYVVALGAMRQAEEKVLKTSKVKYFVPVWVNKIINHDVNSKDCALMLEMEEQLSERYKNYKLKDMSLGYKQSGALYYNEEYRIPNNVYPIFWWGLLKNKEFFNSLFLRP